ncbi:MAG: polysaccharide biosynthesis C-terminal domain-containing protein [Tannerella sp.]|nr:polysaccharide biosynthesis C-terminal domain-containing protein [Tannerella sp.]
MSIIGVRYLVAFLNLLLIFINSKTLGREGMGLVGVIYASANLAVIFNSVLCGNTIVYFMNRYNLRYVFYPAYIWAFVGSAVACMPAFFFDMLPEGYEVIVFGLAVLISLVTANSSMLLGKDNVKGFNLVFILQGVLTFLLLLFLYFIVDYKTVAGYLAGLFAAHVIAYIYSVVLLFPYLGKKNNASVGKPFSNVLKEMFLYGLWSSMDNLAEGLTTRLNYFLIHSSGGYGNVGLLDSGTKMSESVWHVSNSISHIEHNSVSKTTDRREQKRVTLQLFKLTYCALIVITALVASVPEWFFTKYLLNLEFTGIRDVIIGLSPGIVALGSNRILSHYYIGSGRVKWSTFCSVFGLVTLLIAGLFLIPAYGVFGAAVTSSIAYICMLAFSVVVFMKQTGTLFREFIPSKDDWNELVKKVCRYCHGD